MHCFSLFPDVWMKLGKKLFTTSVVFICSYFTIPTLNIYIFVNDLIKYLSSILNNSLPHSYSINNAANSLMYGYKNSSMIPVCIKYWLTIYILQSDKQMYRFLCSIGITDVIYDILAVAVMHPSLGIGDNYIIN